VAGHVGTEHVLGDLPSEHLPSHDVEPVVDPTIHPGEPCSLDIRIQAWPLIRKHLSQHFGVRAGHTGNGRWGMTDGSATRSEAT